MLDKEKSIKEKIDLEQAARKIYVDSSAVPRYSKGRSANHKGEQPIYLNQFQRSKKESEVGKTNVLFSKKKQDKPKAFWGKLLSQKVELSNRGFYIDYRNYYTGCLNFFGALKTMNVPVMYEDETEDEFDLEFCCANCAQISYGWTVDQFSKVFEMAKRGEPIKLPSSVKNETDFKKFVQTL